MNLCTHLAKALSFHGLFWGTYHSCRTTKTHPEAIYHSNFTKKQTEATLLCFFVEEDPNFWVSFSLTQNQRSAFRSFLKALLLEILANKFFGIIWKDQHLTALSQAKRYLRILKKKSKVGSPSFPSLRDPAKMVRMKANGVGPKRWKTSVGLEMFQIAKKLRLSIGGLCICIRYFFNVVLCYLTFCEHGAFGSSPVSHPIYSTWNKNKVVARSPNSQLAAGA